jgi:hypothetical protein
VFVILGAALSNLSAPGLAEEKGSKGIRRFIGAVTAALVLVALVAGEQAANAPTSAKDDARGIAVYLKQNASADDVILLKPMTIRLTTMIMACPDGDDQRHNRA